MPTRQNLLITVGTTSFNFLSSLPASLPFLTFLLSNQTLTAIGGFGNVYIQYGSSNDPLIDIKTDSHTTLEISQPTEHYTSIIKLTNTNNGTCVVMCSFKYCTGSVMEGLVGRCGYVVCHAGVGSLMEGLFIDLKHDEEDDGDDNDNDNDGSVKNIRRIMTVINDSLMDNHQEEIADLLGERGYLIVGRREYYDKEGSKDGGREGLYRYLKSLIYGILGLATSSPHAKKGIPNDDESNNNELLARMFSKTCFEFSPVKMESFNDEMERLNKISGSEGTNFSRYVDGFMGVEK